MHNDYLILGGAGLVGLQVCRRIAKELAPNRVVVASLRKHEAEEAVAILKREFGDDIAFLPVWGNLFVPRSVANRSRPEVLDVKEERRKLLETLYGDFETAYHGNQLVQMILPLYFLWV